MLPTLQKLTVNLAGDAVRDDSMEGEEYWVAPMAMMLEGVANGSQGAVFYPGDEIESATPSWNYKPIITPDHPTEGSACTPEFLTDHKIGVVLNSKYDTKLRAEGWFHKKRTQKIAPLVANALKQRRMMELSTGLYVDAEPVENKTFKGEKYDVVAKNHRPDHLAILPTKIGAFSIRKGAGLLQLNEMSYSAITAQIEKCLYDEHSDTMDDMPSLYPPYVRDVFSDHVVYSFGGKLYDVSYAVGADGQIKLSGKPVEVTIKTEYVPVKNEEETTETKIENLPILNEDELKSAIQAIGRADDPAAARRHILERATELKLTQLLPEGWITNTTESNMDKTKLIDALIKNELTKWEEKDRKALETFNEDQLTKMLPEEPKKPAFSFSSQEELDAAVQKGLDSAITKNAVEVKKKAEEVLKNSEKPTNDPPKEMTVEQFMASMPPQFRAIHNQAMNSFQQEVGRLCGIIIANKRNKFKPEDLAKMDLDQLRNLAELAQNEESSSNVQTVQTNFMGMGVPFPVLNAGLQSHEDLDLPVYNSEKFRTTEPVA